MLPPLVCLRGQVQYSPVDNLECQSEVMPVYWSRIEATYKAKFKSNPFDILLEPLEAGNFDPFSTNVYKNLYSRNSHRLQLLQYYCNTQ